MEELMLFLLTFLLLYLIYQFFIIIPIVRRGKTRKKNNKELLEVVYLKSKYSLDFDKISYSRLLQICAIVSSFDISVTVSIVSAIDNFILKILIGIISISIFIVISYHLVYLFYKKKGMVKNG